MYDNIHTKPDYDLLLSSGMFFEVHPELSGDWKTDWPVIFEARNPGYLKDLDRRVEQALSGEFLRFRNESLSRPPDNSFSSKITE